MPGQMPRRESQACRSVRHTRALLDDSGRLARSHLHLARQQRSDFARGAAHSRHRRRNPGAFPIALRLGLADLRARVGARPGPRPSVGRFPAAAAARAAGGGGLLLLHLFHLSCAQGHEGGRCRRKSRAHLDIGRCTSREPRLKRTGLCSGLRLRPWLLARSGHIMRPAHGLLRLHNSGNDLRVLAPLASLHVVGEVDRSGVAGETHKRLAAGRAKNCAEAQNCGVNAGLVQHRLEHGVGKQPIVEADHMHLTRRQRSSLGHATARCMRRMRQSLRLLHCRGLQPWRRVQAWWWSQSWGRRRTGR
mmetsp:Transcript_53740/g.135719  ORF Transcript_53740/g.135719 Transcript_53740/m.135719 type:complete len:305 (-) Transcript_53740:3672-4586(-)